MGGSGGEPGARGDLSGGVSSAAGRAGRDHEDGGGRAGEEHGDGRAGGGEHGADLGDVQPEPTDHLGRRDEVGIGPVVVVPPGAEAAGLGGDDPVQDHDVEGRAAVRDHVADGVAGSLPHQRQVTGAEVRPHALPARDDVAGLAADGRRGQDHPRRHGEDGGEQPGGGLTGAHGRTKAGAAGSSWTARSTRGHQTTATLNVEEVLVAWLKPAQVTGVSLFTES